MKIEGYEDISMLKLLDDRKYNEDITGIYRRQLVTSIYLDKFVWLIIRYTSVPTQVET